MFLFSPAPTDGSAKPVEYLVYGLDAQPDKVPAQEDGSLKLDLSNLAPGSYVTTSQSVDAWGGVSETSEQFAFVRPGMPEKPVLSLEE